MHDHPTPGPARPVAGHPSGTLAAGHTLRALEHLARGPRSAPELARELGIDPRSARRLLQRLRAEGYAVQDPGHRRRYRATLRLAAVSAELLRADPLRAAAERGVLATLARSTGGTAHVWVADGESVCCLAHYRSDDAAVVSAGETLVLRADAGADGPARVVLAPDRVLRRSTVYLRGELNSAWLASAVVDRGRVVAAVGLTGEFGVDAVARVRDARRALERALGRLAV